MITEKARHWIGTLMLVLFIILVTPSLVVWRMQSATTSMTQRFTSPLAAVSTQDDLKLTDSQKRQIETLEKEYREKLGEQCKRHCSARMELGTQLQDGQVDEKHLLELGRAAGDAYARAEVATVEHMAKVCTVLNPDQKKILLKKVGAHIAATCPKEFLQ